MGGCRCTYRNCTVKSDGQTHMFHYPVFDKVRCHQWLINARKLDFLDLKVSQLKNRVICQHHFKDEYFMNFTKGKLTFDAIPTEDGPYCDSTKYDGKHKEYKKVYSIILEDIDDEYINGFEKKNNFSMKYADFLTNSDLTDGEKIDGNNSTYKVDEFDISQTHNRDKFVNVPDDNSFIFKLSLPDKSVKKMQMQPMLVVPPYSNSSIKCKDENLKGNQEITHNIMTCNGNSNVGIYTEDKDVTKNQTVANRKPKVRIISEKRITEPVTFTGKFEPVSPNFVLNGSQSKKVGKTSTSRHISINNSKEHSDPIVLDFKDIKTDNQQQIEVQVDPVVKIENAIQTIIPCSVSSQSNNSNSNSNRNTSPKVSLLKPKVAPERAAAIEKKRNFNKKLRDIIESCLDKLENADKVNDEIKLPESLPIERKHKTNHTQDLPMVNPHDFTISFLESRMNKMEKTLLTKIEQNSERITELNNSVGKAFVKKNAPVQTKTDEESYKKQLFQEISKYLSPSTKSLIYEELFINKFALSQLNTSPKQKRRKHR